MDRNELIEVMARAIFKQQGFIHSDETRMFQPIEWDELDDPEYPVARAAFRDQAAAAILAIEAQGLAIVPVEATEAMENSAEDLGANGPLSVDCWEAMIRVGRL